MDTASVIDHILEHHGVKGQKWGVRRAERKIARGDKKFAKRITNPNKNLHLKIELHNKAAEQMNAVHHPRLDKKYATAIKNHTLLDHDHPTTKKYMKEVQDAYLSELNKAASSMKSPSGTRQYKIHKSDDDFLGFIVSATDVKHADTDSFKVVYIKDELGRVIGLKIVEDDMAQSAINDILEHHGVKGQKWGVRRQRPSGPQKVTVSDKRKRIKTKGGEGHPAHPDAVSVRKSGQIARKSGLKALSNSDIEAYNRRLNLEQNAKRLMYEDSSPPRKFVLTILRQTGRKTSEEVSGEGSKLIKKGLGRAAKAAVAAA